MAYVNANDEDIFLTKSLSLLILNDVAFWEISTDHKVEILVSFSTRQLVPSEDYLEHFRNTRKDGLIFEFSFLFPCNLAAVDNFLHSSCCEYRYIYRL
jgi:hypothetical protein